MRGSDANVDKYLRIGAPDAAKARCRRGSHAGGLGGAAPPCVVAVRAVAVAVLGAELVGAVLAATRVRAGNVGLKATAKRDDIRIPVCCVSAFAHI